MAGQRISPWCSIGTCSNSPLFHLRAKAFGRRCIDIGTAERLSPSFLLPRMPMVARRDQKNRSARLLCCDLFDQSNFEFVGGPDILMRLAELHRHARV